MRYPTRVVRKSELGTVLEPLIGSIRELVDVLGDALMSYRHFSLTCGCGAVPSRIDEVGLTDERELVIHWWCEACQKAVYASKALSDCWRECPSADATADFDEHFLESIGVKLPE